MGQVATIFPRETALAFGWSPKLPREGDGNPLQYSCLKKSHGQRSRVGYSPWGCKESDTTDLRSQTEKNRQVLWGGEGLTPTLPA